MASVLFGLSVYLADNLQTYQVPVPTEILGMFPYVITIAVVSGLIGRVRPPAADGLPYKRDYPAPSPPTTAAAAAMAVSRAARRAAPWSRAAR